MTGCNFCKFVVWVGIENLNESDKAIYTRHLQTKHGLTMEIGA